MTASPSSPKRNEDVSAGGAMSKIDRIALRVRDFEGCVGFYRGELTLWIKAIRGDVAAFELGSDRMLHSISLKRIAETVGGNVIQPDGGPPRRIILGMCVQDAEETCQTFGEAANLSNLGAQNSAASG